jgi:hypothetical protein
MRTTQHEITPAMRIAMAAVESFVTSLVDYRGAAAHLVVTIDELGAAGVPELEALDRAESILSLARSTFHIRQESAQLALAALTDTETAALAEAIQREHERRYPPKQRRSWWSARGGRGDRSKGS